MHSITRRLVRGALRASLVAPAALAAQEEGSVIRRLGPATSSGEPRLMGGLTLSIGQPQGDFHRYVSNGVGVGANGLFRVDPAGAFAIRLDGGFLNYGRERKQIPLSGVPGGGRIRLDLTTSNNIVWLGAGPQLMAPRGPVRPYVNGTAGFSYFATTSSVEGRNNDDQPFAEDTNYDDLTFSWGGGGGLLIPVHRSRETMVFLDVGARYHNNGRNVRYLREGGIRDLPNGGIELSVIESRADLVTWHIGVSIGGR
jgi:hypothetical protein